MQVESDEFYYSGVREVRLDAAKKAGSKYDDGKPDWTLMPTKPMELVIQVLEFGAKKYGRENWKKVENAKQRYLAAAYRHINEITDGEWLDKDSKKPHAAHAICCLLFILWFGEQKDAS